MILRINARAPTVNHPLDAYWTPPEATRALMAVERLRQVHRGPLRRVWGHSERACGGRPYRARGGHRGLWVAKPLLDRIVPEGKRAIRERAEAPRMHRDPRLSWRTCRNERSRHCHKPALPVGRGFYQEGDRGRPPLSCLALAHEFFGIREPVGALARSPAE